MNSNQHPSQTTSIDTEMPQKSMMKTLAITLSLLLLVYQINLLTKHIKFRRSNTDVAATPAIKPAADFIGMTTALDPDDTLRSTDVVHTVRTQWPDHLTRMHPVLLTWAEPLSSNLYVVTDRHDPALVAMTRGGHVVVAESCDAGLDRDQRLVCQLGVELFTFAAHSPEARWWCHWDDDTYVNVPELVQLLAGYDWRQKWYVGRPHADNGTRGVWYAVAGSGICMSRAVVDELLPLTENGLLETMYAQHPLRDDVMLGHLVGDRLGVKLTVVKRMSSHAHWRSMRRLALGGDSTALRRQISVGYNDRVHPEFPVGVRTFEAIVDPTRFFSFHCLLVPEADFCRLLPELE